MGFLGAASIATFRFSCTGFGVRMGLTVESKVSLGCGFGTKVRSEGTESEAGVRFDTCGSGSGSSVSFVGGRIGTRLNFGATVGRSGEPDNRAKVLSTSGDGTEVGLLGTLAVSKVLGRLRVSRASVDEGVPETPAVGVSGPGIEVISGSEIASGPSILFNWVEGSVVSTTLKLQVPSIGVCSAVSSCCFKGDVVPDVGPGEDGG